MADYQKPIPEPTPETQHFWDGCKDGKLLLQRCKDTGKVYFPPRPFSPYTGGKDVEVFEASGKAKLFSYVINHRPAKGFENEAPYAIAVVELDSDVVFVEGREFKVQKLQSASFKDQEMVASKRKRPVKSQGAYLKTLPALTRQLFRLGKKVSTMPMGAAERVVAADLRKVPAGVQLNIALDRQSGSPKTWCALPEILLMSPIARETAQKGDALT